jgi:hypothetical protein
MPQLPPLKLASQFGVKEPTHFALVESLVSQSFYELSYKFLSVTHLVGPGFAPAAGNERAHAVADLQDPFVLEIPINFDDRVGIDHQRFRQTANSGQLIARRQCASFDRVTDLFLELNVDRNAGGRIGLAKHSAT